jgi:hypothetical protein
MAQGSRKRWLGRTAASGCGVLICTALIGCHNTDQSKDSKTATKQTTGLPGTTTLPPGGTPAKTAQNNSYGNTGGYSNQPSSGLPGANLVTTPGVSQSGITPAGGVAAQPAAQYNRTGNGTNGLTSPPQQMQNFQQQPGAPTSIGAPAMQGFQQSGFPNVGPGAGGTGMNGTLPKDLYAGGITPPPPPSPTLPLPPIPDSSLTGAGVPSPVVPTAPLAPPAGPPASTPNGNPLFRNG